MANDAPVGTKVAQQGVHLARQAALVGVLYWALGRFPGRTKLVTAVGLGAIGAVGFARGCP